MCGYSISAFPFVSLHAFQEVLVRELQFFIVVLVFHYDISDHLLHKCISPLELLSADNIVCMCSYFRSWVIYSVYRVDSIAD